MKKMMRSARTRLTAIPSRMSLSSLQTEITSLKSMIAERDAKIAELQATTQKSKGSQISSKGNKAEALLCSQANVRAALSAFFGKTVVSVEKIPSKPHPKKGARAPGFCLF